jgi:hypothetical protein
MDQFPGDSVHERSQEVEKSGEVDERNPFYTLLGVGTDGLGRNLAEKKDEAVWFPSSIPSDEAAGGHERQGTQVFGRKR